MVERAPDRINIQSSKSPIFYVALAEKYLTDHDTVHIHALGSCIEAAVGVADKLQKNGLGSISKIHTGRSGWKDATAHIVLSVSKSDHFTEKYEEQKALREKRAEEKEKERARQREEEERAE
eukprot:TRINITY_DN6360_c0_g2_i1.p2 TRINITY_DN6360_c0_g2~~TRINITY_DN6360_c0_g2_i1.p2  ORF type:complete len:122 (+),score=42.24 TRINITY_DN6360_c0_g2_i1:82-447(+)